MWEQALMQFAAGAGKGVTSSAPMNLQSGAPADLRAMFSNDGWTVSTGGSKAEGATMTGDPMAAAYGYSPTLASATTAGGGLMLPLIIGGVVLALIIAKKKKG